MTGKAQQTGMVLLLAVPAWLMLGASPQVETKLWDVPVRPAIVRASADLQHVAAWIQTGEGAVVYHDGAQVGGPYERVFSLALSPDGTQVAWAATSGGRWAIYKDGARLGAECDAASKPIWSTDGQHIAFCAKVGKRWRVVKDGTQATPYYKSIAHPVMSADGSVMAYRAGDGKTACIYRNGQRVGNAYGVSSPPFLSADGQTLAYIGQRAPGRVKKVMFKNGQPIGIDHDYIDYGYMQFDGPAIVYRAWTRGKWWLYHDAQLIADLGPGLQNKPAHRTSDGRNLSVQKLGDKQRAIENGQPISAEYDYAWASVGPRDSVMVSGRNGFGPTQTVWLFFNRQQLVGPVQNVGEMLRSPCGRHIVFTARATHGAPNMLYRNATCLAPTIDRRTPFIHNAAGTGALFVSYHDGALWRVEVPWQ